MKRILLAIGAVAIGVTAVAAQDAIATRKQLMKANGQEAKIGSAMVKGGAPFDLAKAKAVFAAYADAADKMGALFPPNSMTGGETTASPKIWEAKADFDAKLKKFGEEARTAGAATKDLDSFKASFATVMRNCGGCHETYRIKKS
ncbi:MAG: cytochrome c [Variibacter sp.]